MNFRHVLLTVFVLCGAFSAAAQERYRTIELGLVNKADTLHWCWADTGTRDGQRALELAKLYTDLWMQRMQYDANQMVEGMPAHSTSLA